MLTYANKPVSLLWEGVAERDGVGLGNCLAMLPCSSFKEDLKDRDNQLLFLHGCSGERCRRARPFCLFFFHFSVFWVARCILLTANTIPL